MRVGWENRMPPAWSRSAAWSSRDEAQGAAHPFRGDRGRRHVGHRRSAGEPRLPGKRLGSRRECRDPQARHAWRKDFPRAPAGAGRGGRCRRGVERCAAGQSRGGRGAREPHSGGTARADAGGADAPEARRGDRRHARQDHDDQSRGERAGRRRSRPDLRDRRAAQCRRQQRAPGRRRFHRRRSR